MMTTTPPTCSLPRVSRGQDIQLAFGELANGTIVHVSEVVSGLACDCVCPGCRARLVARKGALKEHHFGHYRSAQCKQALESALHKLAKQVLDERRELLLPEVRAEIGDQELVTHREEVHRFDGAILEHHLDTIVPDVIVQKGDHRLLVEMFVTHRCGPEKIARIQELGIACLEIDLRKLPRSASAGEVAQALLGKAPRYWIHNPKVAAASRKLQERIGRNEEKARLAAERAEIRERQRREALAEQIASLQNEAGSLVSTNSICVTSVCELGFRDEIGLSFAGDFAFVIPGREWQALIIERFIIEPLDETLSSPPGFSTSTAFAELRERNLLRRGMPTYIDAETEAYLAQRISGFRAPYRVVDDYLTILRSHGILRSYRKTWSIHEDVQRRWADMRRRRWELDNHERLVRSTLSTILRALPTDDRKDFSVDQWWKARHAIHEISFEEAFAKDDRRLTELSHILYQIEAMLVRNGEIVTDLFGLPVAAQRQRIVESRAQEAEEKRLAGIRKQQRDRTNRVSRLTDAAHAALGMGANAWLDGPVVAIGMNPRSIAENSEHGLYEALDELRREEANYRKRARQDQLRSQLLKLADASRRPTHARLFLTSPHPQWGNNHPIESCVDEPSFEQLRQAMTEVIR